MLKNSSIVVRFNKTTTEFKKKKNYFKKHNAVLYAFFSLDMFQDPSKQNRPCLAETQQVAQSLGRERS